MNKATPVNFVDQPLEEQGGLGVVFLLFSFWTFILVCRPQDLFPFLAPLRPALLSTALVLSAALFSGSLFRGPSIFAERQVKLYLAMLVLMVLGIPFSLYARLSFMYIFTVYISVAIHFVIFYKIVDSVKKLSFLLFVVCLGSGLYSAISVRIGNMADGRLFFGDMFDPNDLAYFALSFLPLNLLFISGGNPLWKRLASLGCFAVNILLIVLTGSRGGLLAFGVVSLLLLLRKTRAINNSQKIIAFTLGLVLLSMTNINVERYATMFNLKEDYNVQSQDGRIVLWGIGLEAMSNKPLTGVGVMCFSVAVGQARAARGSISQAWQVAHNSVIQIGTETGVIGLVLFLLMSLNVLRIFNKARKELVSENLVKISEMGFAGFVGLFVSGMFLSQAYSIYWAFYVVFSAVVSQLLSRQQNLLDEKKA